MQTNMNSEATNPWVIQLGTEHLVLCEGKDDSFFLSSFLKFCFKKEDLQTIQVTQTAGVNNIRKMVSICVNSEGFSHLRSLLVIRDADNDIQSARDSVNGAFSNAGLPVPQFEYLWANNGLIKTAFLLMPTCSNESTTGTLDDLCWNILSDKHGPLIQSEIHDFISSLKADQKRSYSHETKAHLHTYFSTTEGLISSGIGRAAEAGAFDWTSERLTPLHRFLISMIEV